jgi:beta-1,4-mannosyl-glycoprotein beta-1,4-N-acetylglucosaminyltransferase
MSLLVDAFIFFDELELLRFRLKELDCVVDKFVLVESDLTHSGEKKRLYFQENKHLFEEYSDRIVHVIYRASDKEHVDPWARETAQRNAILEGINRLKISANDYIMISDCDEVPRVELLAQIKHYGFNIFVRPENRRYIYNLSEFSLDDYKFEEEIFGFLQEYYYYNLECRHVDSIWWQSRIVTYRKLRELEEPNRIRRLDINTQYYGNAGWHFSYFGGTSRVIRKIKGFAHQELNIPKYIDRQNVEKAITNHEDLFGRDFIALKRVPLESNDNLPAHYKMLLQFES